MGQDPAVIRQEIEDTRDRMAGTVDALGYKADVPARAKDSINQTLSGVRQRITGVSADISEATPGRDDVRQAGQQAVGIAQANPLGLALGAAAVGFLAGMLIPATTIENERLGPVSDDLKHQAADTSREALDQGRQVVQDTAEVVSAKASELAAEVTDTVKEAGQAAADSAGQAAQDVSETVQESAETHAGSLADTARENAAELRDSAATAVPGDTK